MPQSAGHAKAPGGYGKPSTWPVCDQASASVQLDSLADEDQASCNERLQARWRGRMARKRYAEVKEPGAYCSLRR